MISKVTVEDLISKVNQEGIGYALLYYYGKDIECEDKVAEKLWKDAWEKLNELQTYLDGKEKEFDDLRAEGLM